MKRYLLLLLCTLFTSCTVNRFYYIAEEPISLYEFPSFSGQPLLTAQVGDTVSATGTKYIQLGGTVSVEYQGYRFYSPSAKARFIRVVKVRSRRDAFLPSVAYTTRLRSNSTTVSTGLPSNYGYTPSTGATIHIGPRGGQYYYNSNGKKTYLSKSSSYRLGTSRSSGALKSSSRSTRSSGSSYKSNGSRSYSTGGRGRH